MNSKAASILTRGILVSILAAASSLQAQEASPSPAPATLEKIIFATDWKAQAEHGGFYQAVATGLYKKRGLDVEIRPGGPTVNVPQLMAAGAIQFGLGSNSFIPLNNVAAKAPVKAVMACFQKDPQVLITHPRDDVKSIDDMRGKPILISDGAITTFWVWLKHKHGFNDGQIRKYTFNLAPFLTDKSAIQQGYITSEPYSIQSQGGVEPKVYLLADEGYPGYAAFILASTKMITEKPQVVKAFVEATIDGWHDYLHGDPTAANELIMKDNPEMTANVIGQAIDKMNDKGIVESTETRTLGLGTMSDERWEQFFQIMSQNGVYPNDLDWKQAYTLDFVNKGYGVTR